MKNRSADLTHGPHCVLHALVNDSQLRLETLGVYVLVFPRKGTLDVVFLHKAFDPLSGALVHGFSSLVVRSDPQNSLKLRKRNNTVIQRGIVS